MNTFSYKLETSFGELSKILWQQNQSVNLLLSTYENKIKQFKK